MQVKIEELEALQKQISDLTALMLHLSKTMGLKQTVNVKDIADMEGVSVTSIRNNCRYLLPDFGVSQYPDGQDRWDIEKYLSWRAMDVTQKRRAYKEMQARRVQQ